MSYNFTKLSEVAHVESFPEGANVIIEDNGEIKRCTTDGLGGGAGGADVSVLTLNIYHGSLVDTDKDYIGSSITGSDGIVNSAFTGKDGLIFQVAVQNDVLDELKRYITNNKSIFINVNLCSLQGENIVDMVTCFPITLFSAMGGASIGIKIPDMMGINDLADMLCVLSSAS